MSDFGINADPEAKKEFFEKHNFNPEDLILDFSKESEPYIPRPSSLLGKLFPTFNREVYTRCGRYEGSEVDVYSISDKDSYLAVSTYQFGSCEMCDHCSSVASAIEDLYERWMEIDDEEEASELFTSAQEVYVRYVKGRIMSLKFVHRDNFLAYINDDLYEEDNVSKLTKWFEGK